MATFTGRDFADDCRPVATSSGAVNYYTSEHGKAIKTHLLEGERLLFGSLGSLDS